MQVDPSALVPRAKKHVNVVFIGHVDAGKSTIRSTPSITAVKRRDYNRKPLTLCHQRPHFVPQRYRRREDA